MPEPDPDEKPTAEWPKPEASPDKMESRVVDGLIQSPDGLQTFDWMPDPVRLPKATQLAAVAFCGVRRPEDSEAGSFEVVTEVAHRRTSKTTSAVAHLEASDTEEGLE